MIDFQALGDGIDLLAPLTLRHIADPQRIADVFSDRHMRIKRIALEHHGDVAVARLQASDVTIANEDTATGRRFKAGSDAQRRRLSAAGWAEKG